MSILLSMLLAQARVLPEVDRRALELQARSEAIQPARPASRTPPRRAATAQPTNAVAATTRRGAPQTASRTTPFRHPAQRATTPSRDTANTVTRPASIRRASGGALDLNAITTICRAAGNQADPAGFLATMSRAYSLDGSESQSLRTSCAAYLAGRADARTNNYGTPAH